MGSILPERASRPSRLDLIWSVCARYGFALVLVAIATLIRLSLNGILASRMTGATYLMATLITVWYVGWGPASLSCLLGTALGIGLFLDHENMSTPALVTAITLNLLVCFMAIACVESTRRMKVRLHSEMAERFRLSESDLEQGERLRITLRSIGDAVIATDRDSRVTSMNPVAETLTGWTEAEARGLPLKTVFRTLRHDTHSSAEMPVAAVIAEDRVVRTVAPALLVSRDGRSRNVQYSTAPMKDAEGQVLGVVLVFHDDTERFRTEQRLAEQTRIAQGLHSIGTRLASELVPERIRRIVVEEAARLIGADYAAFFPVGETTPEVVERRSTSTVGPELGTSPLVSAIFEDKRVIRVKDFLGGSKPLEFRPKGVRSFLAIRVESSSGRTFGALVFADSKAPRFGAIAERLTLGLAAQTAVALDNARLYQDLQESELRFRQLAEHISDVFWMTDPDSGQVIYVSPAYEAIWGKSAESLYTDPRSYLDSIHKEDVVQVAASLEAQHRGEPTADEYRVIRPDGEVLWVWDRAFPVWSDTGKLLRVVGVAENITGRKTAEKALKDSDRRKDEFLAMLAHELRNPLAPIRNALHLLRERSTDHGQEAPAELAMVERQVTHMTRLIEDLLDVSRISRGKITLKREAVPVNELVKHAVETNRGLIERWGHSLNVRLPRETDWILADQTRIEQVLGNLLNNASKYTDPGGKIDLEVTREGDRVAVLVRDSGIGIDAELLPRVFDLFVQAEQQIDRAQGGLGIGLSLVRRLVQMHDGSIEARSQGIGHGCEFIVRFPAVNPPDFRASVECPQRVEIASRRRASDFNGKSRKVLVVDDNRDAATSLAKLLDRLWGQNVQIANDGPSALETAREFLPELIFLDIGLPGISGYEVANELRADPEFSSTTLVALTGWGQESDFQKSKECGFDHHLVKPVDLDAIRAILEELDKADVNERLAAL